MRTSREVDARGIRLICADTRAFFGRGRLRPTGAERAPGMVQTSLPPPILRPGTTAGRGTTPRQRDRPVGHTPDLREQPGPIWATIPWMKLRDNTDRVLDAEFELEGDHPNWVIIQHSRSGPNRRTPGRNPDYFPALELLLSRLAAAHAVISSISVDSLVARELPERQRRLALPFPIRLTPDTDIAGLRRIVTRAQRTVARSPSTTSTGGNNHRRIRIDVTVPAWDDRAYAAEALVSAATGTSQLTGRPYVKPTSDPTVRPADVFAVDPELIERALAAHARIQDALADHVRHWGIDPLSPRPAIDPEYDLAWEAHDTFTVVEVKSLTESNEEKQLRLGLGQLLRYRHLLAREHRTVEAVLAVERSPSDPEWVELCRSLAVCLTWPDDWPGLGPVGHSP